MVTLCIEMHGIAILLHGMKLTTAHGHTHTKVSGYMISHLSDALKPNRCSHCDNINYILICKIN